MARGWESKSVESQMEEMADRRKAARVIPPTAEEIRVARERESLELSRARVVRDLENAANPRYRAQLEAALAHLDRKLKDPGLTGA